MQERLAASMLRELQELASQDSSFLQLLGATSFVPTDSGDLRTPAQIYDPRYAWVVFLLQGLSMVMLPKICIACCCHASQVYLRSLRTPTDTSGRLDMNMHCSCHLALALIS